MRRTRFRGVTNGRDAVFDWHVADGWTLTCVSIKTRRLTVTGRATGWRDEDQDGDHGHEHGHEHGQGHGRGLWKNWSTLIGSKWILIYVWFDFIRFEHRQPSRRPSGEGGSNTLAPIAFPSHGFHPSTHREPLSPMTWAWACRQDYNSSCLFWTVIRINSARLVPAPNQC